MLNCDPVDHVTAAHIGGHLGQNVCPAPQHANTIRSIELMRRENVEIAAKSGNINRHVNDTLTAINDHQRACLLCHPGNVGNGKHRSQNI